MDKSEETRQYTCIKSVKATPCSLYTAQGLLGRKFYKDDCDNMMGYLVEYEDGYVSWSPKSVFDNGYALTETHVDRMNFELEELNERIVKATRALYTPNLMNSFEREQLSKQLEHMRDYANTLYDRIAYSCPEFNNEHACKQDVTKGGSL